MLKRLPALLLACGMLLTPNMALARDHDRGERYEHHHRRHFAIHFGVGVAPRGGYYDRWGYWHPNYGPYGYYDRWGRWHRY